MGTRAGRFGRRPRYDRDYLRARGLDLDVAFQCVELAGLSYRERERALQRATEELGYTFFHHLSRRAGRDQALVVRDARRTLVAFRGSDDIWDWLTNLRAWTAQTSFGGVHRGYYDVAASFAEELKDLVCADPQRRPVFLTGHSMGGALAVLSAALLATDNVPWGGLYTFGQPQVGNRGFTLSFRQRFGAPFLRFVNGADAIAAWTYGARAMLGTPCYFDTRGHLVFGGHLSQVPRLGFRYHRLDHYRYYLRLNRLRLNIHSQGGEETVLLDAEGKRHP